MMVNPIGVVSYALWAKESTYGTAPATIDKVFMELQSASFKARDEMFKKRSLAGGQDVQGSYLGQHEVTVSIESLLTTEGDLWELVLGSLTNDGGTPPEYTAEPANELPSFTTQIGYVGYSGGLKAFNIVGCKVNTAELSISKGDVPAKLRLDIVGQKAIATTPTTSPTQPTGELMTNLDTTVQINGSAVAGVQELTLSINRNIDKKTTIGDRFVAGLYEKTREYTFNMKLYFENMDRYNEFMGGSTEPTPGATKAAISTLDIVMQRDTDTYVKVQLQNVYWEEIESPISLEDLVVTTVSGYAHTLSWVKYKG